MFDRESLKTAFELLGQELVRHDLFIEIAVYGACAAILQFEWRRATEDVDAVVHESVHGEQPSDVVECRFASVLQES